MYLWSHLCGSISSCHSSAAGVSVSPSPAAAPPSSCSLCDLGGSEPRSADLLLPRSCRKTTGWGVSLVSHRCVEAWGLNQHWRERRVHHLIQTFSLLYLKTRIEQRHLLSLCRLLLKLLLHHDILLNLGCCVLCGWWARMQHVLRQAEAVVLHEQDGGWREEPVAAVQSVSSQREQAGAGRRLLNALLQLSNLQKNRSRTGWFVCGISPQQPDITGRQTDGWINTQMSLLCSDLLLFLLQLLCCQADRRAGERLGVRGRHLFLFLVEFSWKTKEMLRSQGRGGELETSK